MRYRLFLPAQASGANAVHFDLFNASGSAQIMEVESVLPVVSGAAIVTGTLAVDVYLTRTSTVGTGGTAATTDGTSLTAATITAQDNSQPLHGSVTARLTPSGGATAGAVLCSRSIFTEETNAGTYTPAVDMVKSGAVTVQEGSGIRVVQGSVASVGNIGYDVTFSLRPKV